MSAGGHWKPYHLLSRTLGLIPQLRRGISGAFLPSLENTQPLENSSTSNDPLLVPKPLSSDIPGEQHTERVVRVSALQSGKGKHQENNFQESDSSDSEGEQLELSPEQKKADDLRIEEAFKKPIKVESLNLIGKRKADDTSTDRPKKKKLKTYGMKVV